MTRPPTGVVDPSGERSSSHGWPPRSTTEISAPAPARRSATCSSASPPPASCPSATSRDRSAPRPSRPCARSRTARGIRVDGICGPETWAALVESGFAPRRPAALRAPPEPARRRRRRAPAPAQRARLRRRARGRDPRPRDRGRAARVPAQRRARGRRHPRARDARGARAAWARRRPGSVAAVREREELRRAAPARRTTACSSRSGPEFQTLGDVIGAHAARGTRRPDHHRLLRRGRLHASRPRANQYERRPVPRAPRRRPVRVPLPLLRDRHVPLRGRLPGRHARSRPSSTRCSAPDRRRRPVRPHLRDPARDPDGRGRLRTGRRTRRRGHGRARRPPSPTSAPRSPGRHPPRHRRSSRPSPDGRDRTGARPTGAGYSVMIL